MVTLEFRIAFNHNYYFNFDQFKLNVLNFNARINYIKYSNRS